MYGATSAGEHEAALSAPDTPVAAAPAKSWVRRASVSLGLLGLAGVAYSVGGGAVASSSDLRAYLDDDLFSYVHPANHPPPTRLTRSCATRMPGDVRRLTRPTMHALNPPPPAYAPALRTSRCSGHVKVWSDDKKIIRKADNASHLSCGDWDDDTIYPTGKCITGDATQCTVSGGRALVVVVVVVVAVVAAAVVVGCGLWVIQARHRPYAALRTLRLTPPPPSPAAALCPLPPPKQYLTNYSAFNTLCDTACNVTNSTWGVPCAWEVISHLDEACETVATGKQIFNWTYPDASGDITPDYYKEYEVCKTCTASHPESPSTISQISSPPSRAPCHHRRPPSAADHHLPPPPPIVPHRSTT